MGGTREASRPADSSPLHSRRLERLPITAPFTREWSEPWSFADAHHVHSTIVEWTWCASANDHGSDHSRVNGAVIGKRSRRLECNGELSAGRDASRVPPIHI